MILGLSSVDKMDKATGGAAFEPGAAVTAIEAFNVHLEEAGRPELGLNSESADLALIAMLQLDAKTIEETLSPSSGATRPGRLYSLARAYKDYAAKLAATQNSV